VAEMVGAGAYLFTLGRHMAIEEGLSDSSISTSGTDGFERKVEMCAPRETVPTNTRLTDTWLSFWLAFVGGYGDAAGFVLAKTFTGHVTGNLVLGAIAVAAHDWRATLGHLSAIVTFLIGVPVSVLIARRPFKAWPSVPFLPIVMGIEVILIVTASLVLALGVAHGVVIFVIFVSLTLGLQNGAFRRVGGISVHTTYLTGTITSLISTKVEKYASGEARARVRSPDPKIGLLCRIWIAFVLGAGTGAAMVLHFKGLGMLGAALLLIVLILHHSNSALMTETS
jgi:uncharacterized membrane protein YoaK (UPF0700 family)